MKHDVIYLDYNASTPCDPRVLDAMVPLLTSHHANPSSHHHRPGQEASQLLADARARVARSLGSMRASEITFTSGATEANNLVIKGVAEALRDRGRHLVSQVTEHPSVLEPLRHLERNGWQLTLVPVDGQGRIRLEQLAEALRPDTVLVSLMLANNETGTIQPVDEAAELAHDRDVPIHCDAAQGIGKVAVDVHSMAVDFLTFSAHKAYGPKGVGGLYRRHRRPPIVIRPQLHGGGQEYGLRSGTPNLPAAIGLARALEIAHAEWQPDSNRISRIRDVLEHRISSQLDGVTVNGAVDHRLPGTSNLSFAGVDGNALLASLPDLAVSSGSACASDHPEPSYVLRAMGVAVDLAAASIRISLGRMTTDEEVEIASQRVVEEVIRLRAMPSGRARPPMP
jgi:cysteine desulfurase